jgi:hypothetical protein
VPRELTGHCLIKINRTTLKQLNRKIGDKMDYKTAVPMFDDSIWELSNSGTGIIVCVVVTDLVKTSGFFKKVSDKGLFVECSTLDEKKTRGLIEQTLSNNQQTMNPEVIDYLLEVVDMDCGLLVSELDKLSLPLPFGNCFRKRIIPHNFPLQNITKYVII